MTFERRGPRDYLQEVRGGTANRRWQAAFELSRSLGNLTPEERSELAAETLRVYETLSGKRPDDLLVRRYLVLVLGPPRRSVGRSGAPPGGEGGRSRHAPLRGLGARQDRRARPASTPSSNRHSPRTPAPARWRPTCSARSGIRGPSRG